MKLVFFLCLLINITFFLWEYRKGAPGIYLPPAFEYSESDAKKIIVLANSPEISAQPITNTVATSNQADSGTAIQEPENVVVAFVGPRQLKSTSLDKLSDTEDTIAESSDFMGPVVEQFPKPQLEQQTSLNKNEETSAIEFERMGDIETMSACYQLIKTVTQDEFVNPSNRQAEKNYTLTFNSQEVPYISSYLVLTLPTDDLQLAKNRRDILKQQGITDLWMFKKGQFKWRISLGLFSSSDKALFAKQQYAQQTTEELDVVPSWQTHNITQVTISAQQKQKISDFEQSFANFIDKDANCL